jgi:Domain of unknown function (DUF1963)
MWSTRDELQAALDQAGLEEWAARLAAAARHTIILETGPVEDGAEAPPLGASRLGGMPDLPCDVPWPWRPAVVDGDGVFPEHAAHPWPLSFVAQIDFAEIHRAGELEGFPRVGRLLFFCDPVDYPWGETAEDQTRSHVIFTTEAQGRLVRRMPPEEFSSPRHQLLRAKDFVFRARRLTPKLWLLPPPWCSRELHTMDGRDPPKGWRGIYPKDWSPAIYEAYDRFWRDLAAKHPSAFGGASYCTRASLSDASRAHRSRPHRRQRIRRCRTPFGPMAVGATWSAVRH